MNMSLFNQPGVRLDFQRDLDAVSIAHEIKQPLTGIVLRATAGIYWLDRSPPEVVQAREVFERIIADGNRAAQIVDDVRTNFKGDRITKGVLALDELIEGAVAQQRGALEERRVHVTVDAEKPLPKVCGNWNQLQQVLRNLITNAIDAMSVTTGPRELRMHCTAYDTAHVVVSVADTGVGVSASRSELLFQPSFTTKPEGMGMGLSICRAIIEAHDGQLWFAPNTPTGAVFSFTLQTIQSMVAG
jgi:signal transduction histidine kinase